MSSLASPGNTRDRIDRAQPGSGDGEAPPAADPQETVWDQLPQMEALDANVNVFDGRTSSYPYKSNTVWDYLARYPTVAAVAVPVSGSVGYVFVGDLYFDLRIASDELRGTIMLHEPTHLMGFGDETYGQVLRSFVGYKYDYNISDSENLTRAIEQFCP